MVGKKIEATVLSIIRIIAMSRETDKEQMIANQCENSMWKLKKAGFYDNLPTIWQKKNTNVKINNNFIIFIVLIKQWSATCVRRAGWPVIKHCAPCSPIEQYFINSTHRILFIIIIIIMWSRALARYSTERDVKAFSNYLPNTNAIVCSASVFLFQRFYGLAGKSKINCTIQSLRNITVMYCK